ncbi:hypothetical protein BH09CHL1_BH09CHL1_18960 [soil metagenome]
MTSVLLPEKNFDSALADLRGSHVAVRVSDYAQAIAWYTEKLDFRLIHEWPFADEQLAYLAPAADDQFWVEILAGGDPLPTAKPDYADLGESLSLAGYHHFCIVVTDMTATMAELRRREVQIVAEPFDLAAINRRLAFIADPFGNLIELSQTLAD